MGTRRIQLGGPRVRGRAPASGVRPRRLALVALGGALMFAGAAASAADESGPAPPDASPAPQASAPDDGPSVPLDRLFELPRGFEPRETERRGGVSEREWRSRFAEARAELEAAEAALQASKQRLAQLAESNAGWGVAPPVPGMKTGPNEAPMDYELSQRIKHEEKVVKEARRRLLDLEVEANIADVPEAWRASD